MRDGASIILMFGASIFVGTVSMRETSKAQILKQRSRNQPMKTTHVMHKFGNQLVLAFLRPTTMLFTERIVLALTIYTVFAYVVIFSFFGSYTYVLTTDYGFNKREVGLVFISIAVGYVLASLVYGIIDRTLYANARSAAGGHPAPEHR
jgi:hypothetical protein